MGCKHHLHSIEINNFSTQCNERFHLKHTKHSYTRAEPRVVWYPPHRWRHGTFQDQSGLLTGLIGADRCGSEATNTPTGAPPIWLLWHGYCSLMSGKDFVLLGTVVFRFEGRLRQGSAALPGECCRTPRESATNSRQRPENHGYAFWEFPKREFASGGLVSLHLSVKERNCTFVLTSAIIRLFFCRWCVRVVCACG